MTCSKSSKTLSVLNFATVKVPVLCGQWLLKFTNAVFSDFIFLAHSGKPSNDYESCQRYFILHHWCQKQKKANFLEQLLTLMINLILCQQHKSKFFSSGANTVHDEKQTHSVAKTPANVLSLLNRILTTISGSIFIFTRDKL